jgi:hypothetical protein
LILAPDADFLLVHALHVPFEGFLGAETIEQIMREGEARIRSDHMSHGAIESSNRR